MREGGDGEGREATGRAKLWPPRRIPAKDLAASHDTAMAVVIDIAAHAKYFLRCLELLPAPYASLDTNRLTVAYFCVSGLDVLGSVARVDAPRIIEWIYSLQVLPSSGGAEGAAPGRSAGFRGGSFMGGPFSAGGGPSSRRAKP